MASAFYVNNNWKYLETWDMPARAERSVDWSESMS